VRKIISGTIKQGDELYMNLAKRKVRIQQVSVYKGAQRIIVGEVSAGNICWSCWTKRCFYW